MRQRSLSIVSLVIISVPKDGNNWKNPENEKTARYAEFGNTGAGADTSGRVAWAKQLTNKEAMKYTCKISLRKAVIGIPINKNT